MMLLLACISEEPLVKEGRTETDSADSDTDTDSDTDSDTDTDTDADADIPLPDTEMRGIWVTRWSWSDADDIRSIFQDCADAGFNTIFFQVRGNFDAYYASAYEPWASRLTGTLGGDPGWDPLQVAVEEGHARGLAVHAYINTFPLWSGQSPPPDSQPPHAYNEHPDWLVCDESGAPMALNSSYVMASAGIPAVRERVAAVAKDIADHYAVDGIHLDYIRYPGSQYSHDAVSEAAFSRQSLSWADWQREQVKQTVAGVSGAVRVPVTAAVWGIYENRWGWSGVSQGNIDYYQDSHAFTQEGLLDANIPMIYWPVTSTPGDRLDFRTLVADHVAAKGSKKLFAGTGNTMTYDELVETIRVSREEGADGVVVFDYSVYKEDLYRLKADVF